MFDTEELEGIPEEIVALCVKIQIEQEIDYLENAQEIEKAP